MPKYYCDYCDKYLTHDSPSVRKSHTVGKQHKLAVQLFYQQFESEFTQSLIESRLKEYEENKGRAGGNVNQMGVISGPYGVGFQGNQPMPFQQQGILPQPHMGGFQPHNQPQHGLPPHLQHQQGMPSHLQFQQQQGMPPHHQQQHSHHNQPPQGILPPPGAMNHMNKMPPQQHNNQFNNGMPPHHHQQQQHHQQQHNQPSIPGL